MDTKVNAAHSFKKRAGVRGKNSLRGDRNRKLLEKEDDIARVESVDGESGVDLANPREGRLAEEIANQLKHVK